MSRWHDQSDGYAHHQHGHRMRALGLEPGHRAGLRGRHGDGHQRPSPGQQELVPISLSICQETGRERSAHVPDMVGSLGPTWASDRDGQRARLRLRPTGPLVQEQGRAESSSESSGNVTEAITSISIRRACCWCRRRWRCGL
ncbi:hypothetical protein MPTK1_1g28390 [Marchantia polymorpha subsp. ruderalis]|uniref:Uncharacterized protein n=1 Tax=Marchantia polymorpha subsp. ruderalis TaxID=1480154 RepID=A0AAF6AV74_MARPO|nr:hypothetical protein Mp_1g28390 [Marchantia polymorpha subsp. ruderalis]